MLFLVVGWIALAKTVPAAKDKHPPQYIMPDFGAKFSLATSDRYST
jgi:hypothetical protein